MQKAYSSNNSTVQAAKRWIDTLDSRGQWRVEALTRRYRAGGRKGKAPPVRLRRFAEGCPPAQMREAMEYLLSKAPYSGVVLNGEALPGRFRPTLTEWRRDRRDAVHRAGTDLGDSTYTLVQDLVDADVPDTLPSDTISTCSRSESTEWTWDAGGIDAIPEPEQGVTWSIQGVRRNEDGTFDYALVKRVAVTQHMPETPVEDGAFETVSAETWDNLYGSPDDGFRDHTSAPVAVPEASATVKLEIQENEDCTYRVRAIRTAPKNRRASQSSRHTVYEGEHDVAERGAAAPLPTAPAPSGGRVRRHRSEQQQDGTFANEEAITVERPVSDAEVTVTVGRRGRRIERVHRNQTSPASTASISVGGSVKVEKTPGGLYTNSIREWSLAARQTVAEACAKTMFKHTDSRTVSGVESIPDGHVTRSNGTTVRRTTEMDDEGAITQTTETVAEIHVPKHVESWTVGLTGVVHQVREASASSGKGSLSYSRGNIGKSVKNTRTEAGRYDIETTEVLRSGSKVVTGRVCDATVFEHRDETSEADPKGTIPTNHVTAGNGKVRRTVSQLRDDGTSVLTEAVTQENPVSRAEVSYRRTAKMLVRTVKDRNVSRAEAIPDSPGSSVEYRRTPGGLTDVTETDVTVTAQPDHAAAEATVFETSQTVQTTSVGIPKIPSAQAGGGVHQTADSRTDDYGVCTTEVKTVTEQTVNSASTARDRKLHVQVDTIQDRNSADASLPELDAPGLRASVSVTPGGRHNRERAVRRVVDLLPDYAMSSADAFTTEIATQSLTDGARSGAGPANARAGQGTAMRVESHRDSDGIVATTTVTTCENAVPQARHEMSVTRFTTTETTEDKASGSGNVNVSEVRDGSGETVTESANMTRTGRYDHTIRKVVARSATWKIPAVSTRFVYRTHEFFRNVKEAEANRIINQASNAFSQKLDRWIESDHGPSSYDIAPRMTLNDFGLYDGDVECWARWQLESAGQTGQPEKNFMNLHFETINVTETYTKPPGATKFTVKRLTLKRHHSYQVGRGRHTLVSMVGGKTFYEGSDVKYVPATMTYDAHLITDIEKSEVTDYQV